MSNLFRQMQHEHCTKSNHIGKAQLNCQNEKIEKIAAILDTAFPAVLTVEYYISFNLFIIHCTYVMVWYTAH